jgi:hypothetical protein
VPPTQYDELWRLAQRIHDTDFVPVGLRGRPTAVLACILYGQALDIPEMVALRHIAVINGRPAEDAQLMRALVKRAGHTLIPETRTATQATITGVRVDDKTTMTVTWTLADAVSAELLTVDEHGQAVAKTRDGKPLPWQSYTRVMLYNRATVELVRAHFGEVLAGFSAPLLDLDVESELAADDYQDRITDDDAAEIVDAEIDVDPPAEELEP